MAGAIPADGSTQQVKDHGGLISRQVGSVTRCCDHFVLQVMHQPYMLGQIAQLKVELRAVEKGVVVSKPTLEARYDLVLDINGKLWRAQVKYGGRMVGDAIYIDLRKETRNNGKKRVYTKDEVDCVLVYAPVLDAVLFLPQGLFDGRKSVNIRVGPTKNGQKAKIIFAEDLRW